MAKIKDLKHELDSIRTALGNGEGVQVEPALRRILAIAKELRTPPIPVETECERCKSLLSREAELKHQVEQQQQETKTLRKELRHHTKWPLSFDDFRRRYLDLCRSRRLESVSKCFFEVCIGTFEHRWGPDADAEDRMHNTLAAFSVWLEQLLVSGDVHAVDKWVRDQVAAKALSTQIHCGIHRELAEEWARSRPLGSPASREAKRKSGDQ